VSVTVFKNAVVVLAAIDVIDISPGGPGIYGGRTVGRPYVKIPFTFENGVTVNTYDEPFVRFVIGTDPMFTAPGYAGITLHRSCRSRKLLSIAIVVTGTASGGAGTALRKLISADLSPPLSVTPCSVTLLSANDEIEKGPTNGLAGYVIPLTFGATVNEGQRRSTKANTKNRPFRAGLRCSVNVCEG
jgi:hypothetical protein